MPIKITHFLKVFYCTTTWTCKVNMAVFNVTHHCLTMRPSCPFCTRAVNLLHILRSVEVLLWFHGWHSSPRCRQNPNIVHPAFFLKAPCKHAALHLCSYVFFTLCELICTPRRKELLIVTQQNLCSKDYVFKTLILVSTLIYGWELKIQQRYTRT